MILLLSGDRWLRLILLIVCCSVLSPITAYQSQRTSSTPAVRFVSGRSAHQIPFELHNNHIYLRVGVNTSEPFLFLLDTGASSIISRQRAESLGLKFRGSDRGSGVGENRVQASIVEGISLHLSGVTLSRQSLVAIPLESLQASLSHPVDGILGYSFFRYFVVEIDYAAQMINLYSPTGYRYAGRGERIPLLMDGELIFTRARVKPLNRAPVKGLFEIDTGGGHALILNKPFVERHHLLTPAQRANSVLVGGIGGSSRVVMGTVENLQLGRRNIDSPSTLFSLATDGLLANGEFDGNIGNDILRLFKIVFDYSRRFMILESQGNRRVENRERRDR